MIGKIIDRAVLQIANQTAYRLDEECRSMLKKATEFYKSVVAKLQEMQLAIDEQRYADAKSIHESLMSENNLSITIISGPKWEDARVEVVPVDKIDGRELAFNGVFAASEPSENAVAVFSDSQGYSVRPCTYLFGRDGYGVYSASGELMLVSKGLACSEFLASVLEQSAGLKMLEEWGKVFEAEMLAHGDHKKATAEADSKFAAMLAKDA